MNVDRDTEIWKQLFSDNQDALKQIFARQKLVPGSTEVDFVCELPSKEGSVEARRLLCEVFTPSGTTHVFSMSTGDSYEINLSLHILTNAEAITDVEVVMLNICRVLGGKEINWGFMAG